MKIKIPFVLSAITLFCATNSAMGFSGKRFIKWILAGGSGTACAIVLPKVIAHKYTLIKSNSNQRRKQPLQQIWLRSKQR